MLDTLDRMNTTHKSIRIDPDDWNTLQAIAEEENLPLNRLINQWLEEMATQRGYHWNGLQPHGGGRYSKKQEQPSDD